MYDLIIIGGGPAAMSAAIYAARYKLKTLVLAKLLGGAITEAHDVQNYPGFKEISGMQLMKNMEEQARFQGVEIESYEVSKIEKSGSAFKINSKYEAKSILLALGTKRRKLGIKGEDDFSGKGVSYCATCDAAFFKDKVVGVVGGANSAAMAAQLLAEHSSRVYIIYRREPMRAEPARVEQLEKNPRVEFVYNNNVKEIHGENLVNKVILENEYNGSKELELNGLFIEIGAVPSTALAQQLGVDLNERGLIIVDAGQRTSAEKVYAAGDITTNSDNFWQVVTAVAEGAIAAHSAYLDLKKE